MFGQLPADKNLACAAATIKLDRAKRQAAGVLQIQRAQQDYHSKRDEHRESDQRGAANGDAQHQKHATEDLEPWQNGCDRIQRQMMMEDVILAYQLKEFDRVQHLAHAHINEQSSDEPPRQYGKKAAKRFGIH